MLVKSLEWNFPHVWPARLHSGTHRLCYIMACGWALDRLSQGDRTQVETLERWHLRAQGVWLPGVPWSLTVDQPLKECTHTPVWLECPVNESCALDVTMPTSKRTGKNEEIWTLMQKKFPWSVCSPHTFFLNQVMECKVSESLIQVVHNLNANEMIAV